MKSPSLTESVWQTVCWFDIFGQAASPGEIHRFLFREKARLDEVEKALRKDPRISHSFGFYFPRGENALVLKRCAHHHRGEKLWRKVLRYHFFFRLTPFIRLAAIGNTLAMGWPEKNSDIDLLVVAKKNRLFTARFFLTLLAEIFGMRRTGKKIAGKFCLSFFLSDSALDLEKIKIGEEDPYLAFWIATLIPIYGGSEEFFAANNWIKAYFPNLRLETTQKKFPKKALLEKILSGRLGDWLERALKNWQLKRAEKKRQNKSRNAVVICEEMLKFHETDRREEFLKRWQKKIGIAKRP